MAAHYLLPSFILFFISNTGFSTEDTVFVKTGDPMHLNIQRYKLPKEFDDIIWKNDKSYNVVRYTASKEVKPHSSYKDRVEFNTKSFSLTLKNMKKTDSGVYTAIAAGENDTLIAEHRVSVIDAVKTPELTIISYWSSSDSCTVNFTCRAHDFTLNSIYNNGNCSPEEVTSHEKFTLILICSDKSIICNHSNPVSSETDTIDIKQLCQDHPENSKLQNNTSFPIWMMIFVPVSVVLLVGLLVFYVRHRKRNTGTKPTPNTVYAEVNAESQPMETIKNDFNPYDVPDQILHQTQETKEDKQTTTIYHTVGQHLQPEVTAVTDHTIYSQVCKQPPKRPDTTSSNCT